LANTKSAKKSILVSAKKAERNKTARTTAKSAVKKAEAAVKAKSPEAATTVKAGQSALDKAAKKDIIHPNSAARKKSRLMKKLNTSKTA